MPELLFLGPVTLFKKEALAQVFPSEFCEICKNTFSYRTPPVAASGNQHVLKSIGLSLAQNQSTVRKSWFCVKLFN